MRAATVSEGAVRAFEPRMDADGRWHCRGRLPGSSEPGATTHQCGARLLPEQQFCGRCGGLVAWGGTAWYRGTKLKHLEYMELTS